MSIVIKVRVSVPVLTGDGRVDDERERFDDESYSEVAVAAIAAMSLGTLAACGSSTSGDDSKGKVYYLNFKPEAADQWAALAKEYTKEKGVDVKVQTAASGTYEQTLKSEIAKTEAPTLFQVNGPVGYQNWKKYTADMSNTDVYKELTNQDVALKDGDKVVGVPYVMETYGLIYNKDILNKYFALDGAKATSMDEIDNFDTLKAVADDMQSRKDELGIKGAFTSAGFDSSSDWRFKTHLANLPLYYEFKDDNVTEQPATIKGTYLPNYKKIFDLYITDSTTDPTQLSAKTGDDANSEFALGEAAFYQNGTWAWTDLQKAAKKISSKTDAKGFSFQMKPDPYDFEMYLWSNDTAYSDENGTLEGNIDSAKAIDTYQMFQDMEKDGSAVATEGNGTDEFRAGTTAMYIYGSWALSTLDEDGLNYGVVDIPRIRRLRP